MEENPLLAVFAKLVADFLNIPANEPDLLRNVLVYCARALLQGQDPVGMRDTFEFERIEHFTTQYLEEADYALLREVFDSEAMAPPPPGQPGMQLFFRELPNRATWLRSSIPNWAVGAALTETLGSLVNRDGRRFWIDTYQTLPNTTKAVRTPGATRPLLYLVPDGALSSNVVGMALNFPMTQLTMGEGTIWIQARLFTREAPEELYCGLRVTAVTLVSPRMSLPDLWIIQHPLSPFIKSTLTIHLAPPVLPEVPDTPLGTDARQAVVQLPERLKITLTPTTFSVDEINGSPKWNVYGDQKSFNWPAQAPSYNSSLSAVSIPMAVDTDEFVSSAFQSPLLGLYGSAPITAAAWLLPAAKLATPLRAAGAGMLSAELEAGLRATFVGWLDANQMDPAQLQFGKTLLTAGPDLLQLLSIQTASEYVRQVYQLWVGEAGRWNELELQYRGQFPFLYQCNAAGLETYVALGNCTGHLDRPVTAAGQPAALQTKNSMCIRAHGSTGDHLVIYDENILQDNLVPNPFGVAATFQSLALALNNALLTVSPVNAFLLSSQLPATYNALESASLTYAFGLLGYLPTLPDPYAANTGIFEGMLTQRQGHNGAYSLDQISRLLVATMNWQAYEAPAVRFIFGDMNRAAGNLPLRLSLLQNLPLATNTSFEQYSTRAQKAAARMSRRTGFEPRTWNHEYDINIHVNDSIQNRNFFSLLDVSTAADWMGVNVGFLDERLLFERSFEVVADQNPLSAQGMDVVATGRFVRLFTVPQISWEPVTNLTQVVNAANDPPAGLLLFKDDGPPTLIGNTGKSAVPIAPLPLARYLAQNYREHTDFKAWSFFTLPFGMLGMARYDQQGMNIGETPGATIDLVQEQFADGLQTSLQISTKGYLHPQGNRNFEGATEQLSNLYSDNGGPLDRSILSRTVTDIFNGEFGTNGNNGRLRQRGVPVERYDFSGYGANLFSHWLNNQAKIGQTSQAKFDVWRGRTAHEVIQVRSIVYPWGIRVVRTITMFRESTGLVYRVDSGWRAESDGVYDFKTELIIGKDAQDHDIVVLDTKGYVFHPGIVKGVFAVRNIEETQDVSVFSKSWNKTYGYYLDPNDGLPKPVGAGQNLTVSMMPVYFDADVQLEDIIQGGVNNRVPSKRMLGFLQIGPQGVPIAPEDFALLLQENQGLGGPVDLPPDNPDLPSVFDELLLEASLYDDGFAKIVHAHQPVSEHLLKEERDQEFPVTNDAGIRLAWDDEQLLIWMNRQLEEDPAQAGTERRVDAPMGVMGYRVDVREKSDDPNLPNNWTSLCLVQHKAELMLGDTAVGALGEASELSVEVYPAIPDGDKKKHFWLPAYFAYWMGKSLVLQDEDAIDLYHKDQNELEKDGVPQQATKNTMYDPLGLEAVNLRYGGNYDFRVRLADLSGGGPLRTDARRYDAPAPEASWLFRRHAIPRTVQLANDLPTGDDTYFADPELLVRRPLLGYPSVLFTEAYPNALELLKADLEAVTARFRIDYSDPEGNRPIGLADPDVDRLEIEVAVRSLDMDTTIPKHQPQDNYAILYTTTRAFPAGLEDTLPVALTFRDCPVLDFNSAKSLLLLGLSPNDDNIDELAELVLPTNRDIQITIRALCAEKPDYYADNEPLNGMITRFVTRQAPLSEAALFKATSEQTRIRGIYLRRPAEKKPAGVGFQDLVLHGTFAAFKNTLLTGKAAPNQQPELVEQVAKALDVEARGMSITGKTGQRWQFGAARAIRHTLAPDNSSLTFATEDDLVNHWLVPITLLLDRDWSWDGILPTSIDVLRRKKFSLEADWGAETLVGSIELKRGINIQALTKSDRSQTFVCFLDAVEPKSAHSDQFPDEIEVAYRIQPNLKMDNPDLVQDEALTLALLLPITTPPAQMPKVVGAGMALSSYVRDATYANTETRQRFLWVEFDEPLHNPRDAYFGRMTAYAPDPLLAAWTPDWMEPVNPPPALAIDPEPLRLISPGHSDDKTGLNAMQQLIPATESKRHFLVPLPPGLHAESPELFGFFTYEFRVGHRNGWSTAQGRFGRPLDCRGVQHPAPQLYGLPDRDENRIRVSATHAEAVFDGRRVTAQPVRTQLWALLYAQVRMADNSDNRNVLLDDRRMVVVPDRIVDPLTGEVLLALENSDAARRSETEWTNAAIRELLQQHGLAADSALSILCVEMMPTADQFVMNNYSDNHGAALYARGDQDLSALSPDRARRFLQTLGYNLKTTEERVGPTPEELYARPLSDDLGYYRLLRTSTLVAVPAVCCTDC
jgi:hypothetical protein